MSAFRVGVTGHRHLGDGEEFTARSLREVLMRLQAKHPVGVFTRTLGRKGRYAFAKETDLPNR